MAKPISVLMITSEWPTPESPHAVPFIVRQVNFLRRADVSVDVFHFRGNQNPFNYLRAWISVRRKLWQKNYDLVHAQFGQSGALAIPKRHPLVVTFRGDDLEGIVGRNGTYTWRGYVLRAVSALVARHADAVILVSESLKRRLPGRDVCIIPSGVDFDGIPILPKRECREKLKLPLNKALVLFVGNPAEKIKRYELAQKAMAQLDPSLNASLVVACGLPHSHIPIYMNACDSLIFTSMHEGSPNVIKEALACNLPVVSVDVGDVQQRLRGLEGCAVAADDRPETLARELTRVLKGKHAIDGRRALLDLDESSLTQMVIGVYRSVLPQTRTTAGSVFDAATHA
jgi:glycosyltransferase involved in cell wall biosynthesis